MADEKKNEENTETNVDQNQQQSKDGAPLPQDLLDEIDSGVDDVVEKMKKEHEPAEDKEVSEEQDNVSNDDDKKPDSEEDDSPAGDEEQGDKEVPGENEGDEGEEDDSEEEENQDAISDEHLERAVKAGLSISEAKSFGSAKLLESVVSRLEEAAQTKGDDNNDDGNEDNDDDDPLKGIPDLNPEEYDEKIITGFKALEDIARDQQRVIKELRQRESQRESQASSDWFSDQVVGLKKEVGEALKTAPEKREQLKNKFDTLTAGYKATDQEVDRNTVFSEAVAVVLGDVTASAAAKVTKSKLQKRSKQHISRPSASKGKAKGDAFDEVAEELDKKYFDK